MKIRTNIFKLVSTDMTHLGGPMGSEYTTTNFVKYFSSVDNAKKHAEKDFGDQRTEPIEWKKKNKSGFTSGDLRYVMYDIESVVLED